MKLAAAALAAAGVAAAWGGGASMPDQRGEVAAAVVGREIAIVGGFVDGGGSSARVDAYDPAGDRWRRLPDLPVVVNHTMAAASRGRLYVVGGYGEGGRLRSAFVLERGRWRPLPQLPYGLAAGGAAVVAGKLYIVGGVAGSPDRSILVRRSLVLDLARPVRWRFAPAPTGREHLGVTALGGRIYAVAGRSAGLDTNTRLLESWKPGERAWRKHAPVPDARGGTGAAAVAGRIVSVGGEALSGTIATVYAYDPARDAWNRLDDLPTPRHGLGVAGMNGRVYVIAGGRTPGLAVSDVVESLAVPR